MAVTQTQLDALVSAYASGTMEVAYDGRVVKYRSMQQIAEAIATVARMLGVDNPLSINASDAPPRRTYLSFSRG